MRRGRDGFTRRREDAKTRRRTLTQEAIGQTLHVGQPAVAKLERGTDLTIANLRRFVEAMGGELEIVAHFPDGDVTINNFADLGVGV